MVHYLTEADELARQKEKAQGAKKVFSIVSGKGGVGKSTITVSLGTQLCKLGKRVLLIDMDEGLRSLDLMLGISSSALFEISDVLNGNCELHQAVIPAPHCPNLYIIPAPVNVGSIEEPQSMKALCANLREHFDFILIDSPAGVGAGFNNAIIAAEGALVVTTPEPVSVRGANSAVKALRAAGTPNIRLIINKVDTKLMRTGVFLNIDEIIDTTSLQLIAAVPFDSELVRTTVAGDFSPRSEVTAAIIRLARRLLGDQVPLGKIK